MAISMTVIFIIGIAIGVFFGVRVFARKEKEEGAKKASKKARPA